jgi:hypothetical protein
MRKPEIDAMTAPCPMLATIFLGQGSACELSIQSTVHACNRSIHARFAVFPDDAQRHGRLQAKAMRVIIVRVVSRIRATCSPSTPVH